MFLLLYNLYDVERPKEQFYIITENFLINGGTVKCNLELRDTAMFNNPEIIR